VFIILKEKIAPQEVLKRLNVSEDEWFNVAVEPDEQLLFQYCGQDLCVLKVYDETV